MFGPTNSTQSQVQPKNERLGRIADWIGITENNEEFELVKKVVKITKFKSLPKEKNRNFQQRVRTVIRRNAVKIVREPSVKVLPEWNLIEEIEFSRLSKLSFDPDNSTDLLLLSENGNIPSFDKLTDKITPKTEKHLISSINASLPISNPISSDQEMKQFFNQGDVFASDTVLALLMASPRSVYPWDILFTRSGTKLFIDLRQDSTAHYLTVNETAMEPPSETEVGINSALQLAQESTLVNQQFISQVTKGKEAFKYRQIQMGNTRLITRSKIDAQINSEQILIRTFLEFERSEIDWRQKLETQKGAVIAAEMKNNSMNLSRLTFQAILAGVPLLKLGYVSRWNLKDNHKHVILGTMTYSTNEFISQMNLPVANGFGILKALTDFFLKMEQGRYILVKDANKPTMRIYQLPSSQ